MDSEKEVIGSLRLLAEDGSILAEAPMHPFGEDGAEGFISGLGAKQGVVAKTEVIVYGRRRFYAGDNSYNGDSLPRDFTMGFRIPHINRSLGEPVEEEKQKTWHDLPPLC